ncbi:unnamed protein product [Pedinophyceae sp. YPF-701]|nr:unnamed protein product [Pedinophyceae sp. YPF-701]
MASEVQLRVVMTCSGCSGAVTRVLNKMENVSSVDADLDTQLVTVKGTNLDPAEILAKVQKTGKAAELVNS